MIEWMKLTAVEIDALDRNLPVLVPIGLVEAHGAHLPVSVDVDTAVYFATQCAERTGAILAPAIAYGFSDEMREYPGSIGVTADTLMAMVADLCKAFCFHGFQKVIFITGHGANKAPCELAFYRVWEHYPQFKGACFNWWSDCGIEGIHHADKGETEVAAAVGTPVYMERAKDNEVEKPWYKIRSRFDLDRTSGGVNGCPTQADFKQGNVLRDLAVERLVTKVLTAIDD